MSQSRQRWLNRVRTGFYTWRSISQDEVERVWTLEIEKDGPVADGHLEGLGHEEAAETTEQCCTNEIPQWWWVIRNLWAANREEFTRNLGDEPRHSTAHPAFLLSQTVSRARVTEPTLLGTGIEWVSQHGPPIMPHWAPFWVLRKKLWGWRDRSWLHMW